MKKYLIALSLLVMILVSSCEGGNKVENNNTNAANTQDSANNTANEGSQDANTGTSSEASDEQKPDDATNKAVAAVKNYFDNLSSGNYEAAANGSFANEVDLWITMKNTNPKAIATEAKRFLSTKEEVKYTPNLAGMFFNANKGRVVVRQEWKNYDVTLEVLLEFDENTKIKSYKEGNIYKMKVVKPSALDTYLSKITKMEYPVKVASNQFSSFKKMGTEGKQLLIRGAIEGENYQDVGYFSINDALVGIVYIRGYRSYQDFILRVFDRTSGKMLSLQSIGSMGGGHVMMGYNTECEVTIAQDGSIVSNWNTTERNPMDNSVKKSSGSHRYQITPDGRIKRL